MKFNCRTIGTRLAICLGLIAVCFTLFGVEFPGSAKDEKVVAVMADGKAIAEMKILVPAIIEVTGTNFITATQPGGRYTMRIKDASVEIRSEKGKTFKVTGELIYIYGYKKPEQKQ